MSPRQSQRRRYRAERCCGRDHAEKRQQIVASEVSLAYLRDASLGKRLLNSQSDFGLSLDGLATDSSSNVESV